MKVSEDLFHLIKSLDQSEKRYFKIFASMYNKGGDSNNYVRLFDAIDKQAVSGGSYDEDTIKKQFKDDKFAKQLHVAKNYLYNNILKSLRLYNSERSKASELSGLIRDIENLMDKSLYLQSKKLIEKAKKIALFHERYIELLQIIDIEKIIARTEAYAERSEEELLELHKEQTAVMEKLGNINEYWNLTIKSFFLRKKQGTVRNKTELNEFNELMRHPYLETEDKATTYISKNFYFNLKGLQYLTNQDYPNLYEYCKRQIEFMEEYPHLIKKDNYINSMNNLLLVEIELERYNEAFETIKKLRSIESTSVVHKAHIFVISYEIEINLYLRMGNFSKGVLLIPEIEKGFKEYRKNIDKEAEILFYYNIAYLLFGDKQYGKALDWLNKILNSKELDLREDIQCFARIFNLFIHYEMKNYDLIEYIIRSTQRFLSSHKTLREFESMILAFMKKIINVQQEKDRLELLNEMKFKLNSIASDITVTRAFEYFDFISWIESKIRNTDLSYIIKEKYSKPVAVV